MPSRAPVRKAVGSYVAMLQETVEPATASSRRLRKRSKNLTSAFESTACDADIEDEGDQDDNNVEDNREYEVEEVLDERIEEGKVLIKWVGYEEQTWEPVKEIPKQIYNRFVQKKKNVCNDIKRKLLCVVCHEDDQGGRSCISCKKSVHHMCSNELLHKLGVEEVLDVCYCSSKCYERTTGSKISSSTKQTTTCKKTNSDSQKRGDKNSSEQDKLVATMSAKKKRKLDELTRPIDALLGQSIAFAPKQEEEWLSSIIYAGVGSTFLVGLVTRSKGKNEKLRYEIKWTNSNFQSVKHVHHIPREKVQEGIRNYETMMKARLPRESWDVLCTPYNEVSNAKDLWDDYEEVEKSYVRFEPSISDALPLELAEVEMMKSMDFRPDVFLAAPIDLYSHSDGGLGTHLTEQSKELFKHSASSAFFAMLPLSFWRTVVDNTNANASTLKQPNVTLDEMMKFLGILFYMAMVDKGEQGNYWGEQIGMFGEASLGFEQVMSFKRYKFIRSHLCFRDSITRQDLMSDPAARIRPLINMLKLRSPSHVVVGRNVAVDESSIACRSKYGRHMILYNSSKPTGKYHFKIYMMCCSETWYGINMKLHCASGISERLRGVEEESTITALQQAMEKSKDVRKHVLEVTVPIHKSNRIVNTDNYYTSVQLLESLRCVGLYCRGTIRENSKFGHKCFMLKKTDLLRRGTTRIGVDLKHKIVGASWVDNANVNILSNADDSSMSSVTRMIGNTKMEFQSPTCIGEYNQAMQGVDRIDQLRSRFSIADGHSFKKWHKKLAMAYIDIARCNAFIGRKMAGVTTTQRDPHRQFMIELSSQLIHGEWMKALGDIGMLYSAPSNARFGLTVASPRIESPSRSLSECSFENSRQVFPKSRARRGCAVCRFECRHPSEQTVYCGFHHVALCTSVHTSPILPFMCQDGSINCWKKFHSFYFPAGLFNLSGNIRKSCNIFQEKKKFETSSTGTASGLPTILEEEINGWHGSQEGGVLDIPVNNIDVLPSVRDVGYESCCTIGEYKTISEIGNATDISFDFTGSDVGNNTDVSVDYSF